MLSQKSFLDAIEARARHYGFLIGVEFGEGFLRRARRGSTTSSQPSKDSSRASDPAAPDTSMKIGITCYPTFGGSGVVATELGIALADRGDEVHFISYALPSRLALPRPGVYFHEVVAPTYPLFVSPPYTLALATKMAEVARARAARPPPRPLRAAPRDLGDPGARDERRQRRSA